MESAWGCLRKVARKQTVCELMLYEQQRSSREDGEVPPHATHEGVLGMMRDTSQWLDRFQVNWSLACDVEDRPHCDC
jgi:hypothetical protein